MKKNIVNLILIVSFLAGLSLLLYPTVSDYWNRLHQSRAVASYAGEVAQLADNDYGAYLEEARRYNMQLDRSMNRFNLTEEETKTYENLLNIAGNGIMGYIEIDKIGCTLPVYHGTDATVLQIAIGHIEGSSLPVGGETTHCILSGHRGLPSAKLFSDLDQMEIGDTFVIRVLNETMTYEVDQIRIVLPHEVEDLEFLEGEDLCTLVTCTPYGINSHRLLVRGHRIENLQNAGSIYITSDAMEISPKIVALFVGIPLFAAVLLLLLLIPAKPRGSSRPF